jgi:hypothetical protein
MTRNRQLSRAIDNCRRDRPMLTGYETWSDDDREEDREEDEEIPSAEHQAAMASIGEYTYFAQGTASNSTTPSTQPPPTIPSQPSAETAAQSSLTENQLLMLAQMDKPTADRMRVVFQDNNTHGTSYVFQRYHNPQQQDPPLDNPIQDTASTSRLQGLTAEEIRHAIADTKEENQSRIHQHMAKILKKP